LAAAVALLVGALGRGLGAMFVMPDVENVPIDRVIANLESQLRATPDDLQARLNLARVHAMAYADKSGTARVTTGRSAGRPAGVPWLGIDPGSFRQVSVKPAADAADRARAAAHLAAAIAAYDEVLRRDSGQVVAKLGRAWCIEQTGDRAAAIAAYRDAFAAAWNRESAGGLPEVQNLTPVTVEIAGYLVPLLDPQGDAPEIDDIRAKSGRLSQAMRTRPITPIVVPLGSRTALRDLVDRRASVAFDADGSGLRRRWSWITPDAGWLVFDKHHRREVTSALQWFGSVTFWLFWDNGYAALRALDDNGDGELRGIELEGLAIWRDANGNGVSEPREVQPLDRWNIVALTTRFSSVDDPDALAMAPAGVEFRDGSTRPTYDVLLYAMPSTDAGRHFARR